MVSSGGIDNGRPVLFSSLRFNCLAKNLTFVNMNLKSGMMVFIQTAPCGAVCILYEKGSFVIQSKEQVCVVINELFLKCPVESLKVGIHLGRLGIGVVVNEMQILQSSGEMFLEFRTIVRQNVLDLMWKDFETQIEEFLGCIGRVRRSGPSKTKTSVNIFEGNDISSNSIHKTLNGIEGN